MKSLDFDVRPFVRVTVTTFVVAVERFAQRADIDSSTDWDFDIVTLATIAHLRGALKADLIGTYLAPNCRLQLALHCRVGCYHRRNGRSVERTHEGLRGIEPS